MDYLMISDLSALRRFADMLGVRPEAGIDPRADIRGPRSGQAGFPH
jgi:hypothetical protein